MKKNDKRPAMTEHQQGEISFGKQDKDTKKLSKRQRKVYELLLIGKHSVTDIVRALGYSDPRGYIRDLRCKGYLVNDEWVTKQDTRFKIYWTED